LTLVREVATLKADAARADSGIRTRQAVRLMRTTIQRMALLGVLVSGLLVALATPTSAATDQISGVSYYDTTGEECGPPPPGYEDFTTYPPLVMTGDLEGCWYTRVDAFRDNGAPSGVYMESGQEVFVGTLNGEEEGIFVTSYRFESKWTPDVSTGSEVHGRCQHPLVAGTGDFAGATGRVDFKDDVTTGLYYYRGHITLG
jgi:hypothetical protein